MPETLLVFVYGTLKRGGRGHELCRLHEQHYFGTAVGRGLDLYLVPGMGFDFPAAVPGTGTVSGELYAVDRKTLVRMAQFETALYKRAVVDVTATRSESANTFLWDRPVDGLELAELNDKGHYHFPGERHDPRIPTDRPR